MYLHVDILQKIHLGTESPFRANLRLGESPTRGLVYCDVIHYFSSTPYIRQQFWHDLKVGRPLRLSVLAFSNYYTRFTRDFRDIRALFGKYKYKDKDKSNYKYTYN